MHYFKDILITYYEFIVFDLLHHTTYITNYLNQNHLHINYLTYQSFTCPAAFYVIIFIFAYLCSFCSSFFAIMSQKIRAVRLSMLDSYF